MADPGKATTVIGADTTIKGEMNFESTARILGTFEGQIHSKGEVQIAEGATCKAGIEAGKVLIEGTVEGNIHARERMELSAKSRMKGDIVANKLVVTEGAAFSGHVTVGPDAATKGPMKGGAANDHIEAKPAPVLNPFR